MQKNKKNPTAKSAQKKSDTTKRTSPAAKHEPGESPKSDKAWAKGYKNGKTNYYRDPNDLMRRIEATFQLTLIVAKSIAKTNKEHERIGYCQGLWS